jgi:hypothetical protein
MVFDHPGLCPPGYGKGWKESEFFIYGSTQWHGFLVMPLKEKRGKREEDREETGIIS